MRVLPDQLRRTLWLKGSGALQAKRNNPNYYQRLLQDFAHYPNPCFYQIGLDLERTFPEAPQGDLKPLLAKLKKVLFAYTKRNPTVGYCQGMNFVAGRLLQILDDEEDAFWTLTCLLEEILPIDYYSIISGVLVDQRIFTTLLRKKMPHVVEHIQAAELDLALIAFQWFLCLFTYNLPEVTSLRVWDMLFIKGSKFLFRVALAVIELMRPEIMKCQDFSEIFFALERLPKTLDDPLKLMAHAEHPFFRVKEEFIEQQRAKFFPAVIRELKTAANKETRNSGEDP